MTILTPNRAYQPVPGDSDTSVDRMSDDDDALLNLTEEYEPRRKAKRPNWYFILLARYPIVVALFSLTFGGFCFLTLYFHPLPSFDDPTAGFEARGTAISSAHRTFTLLRDATSYIPDITLALQALNITQDMEQMFEKFFGDWDPDDKDPYPTLPDPNPPRTDPASKAYEQLPNTPGTGSTSQQDSYKDSYPTVPDINHATMDTVQNLSPTSSEESHIPTKDLISTSSVAKSRSPVIGESTTKSITPRAKTIEYTKSPTIETITSNKLSPPSGLNAQRRQVQRSRKQQQVPWMHQRSRRKRSADDDICSMIDRGSVKLVFEARDGGNLWTLERMKGICEMQDKLILPSLPQHPGCSLASLPLYLAAYFGKSCYSLTQEDLDKAAGLLQTCAPYACLNGCPAPPPKCRRFSGAFLSLLYFMLDKDFIQNTTSNTTVTPWKPILKYTMVFYSEDVYLRIISIEEYFRKTFEKGELQNDHVKITGFYRDLNDKVDLFNSYMREDLKFFIVAAVLVLFTLTVYLGSFTLNIATVVNLVMSLGVAYFFYTVVCRIKFFPFMNVLAGIILIAVGADDVFVYSDTWQMVKDRADDAPQEKVVAHTFRHAAVSIFVTSLTTSAAFFANYVSRIAAIRCFGLFAGLAILANFFFMITWTPSVIVLQEQICDVIKRRVNIPHNISLTFSKCLRLGRAFRQQCARVTHCIYGRAFPYITSRLWLPCIVVLLAVGIGGFVVVFAKPRLKLPDSKEFPLFPVSQLMEHYDQNLRDKFRWQLEEAKEEEMTVFFVWGAFNQDNGNRLDPNDDGHLVLDPAFNLTAPESQLWMKKFCRKLVASELVETLPSDLKCLMDIVEDTQTRICNKFRPYLAFVKDTNIPMCCDPRSLPYSATAFKTCMPLLLKYVRTSSYIGNIMFNTSNNDIAGFQIKVTTKQNPTTSYPKMNKLVTNLNKLLKEELETAPPGLKNAWFMGTTDAFVFYDLQKAISHGTYSSIELSVSVACITMFLCSLNLVITLYSMLTISLAIAVTIGSLVLMGWQLNIIESVTISLAVGMSIDFTIHFGVAYVLAPTSKSRDRVHDAFIRVGPAVAMAALTTIIAGASVMPTRVRAYQELGLFLMLVMASSWVYANFFFQSVCSVIGPKGNLCQVPLPWKGCKNQQHYENPAAVESLDIHSLSSVDSDDDTEDVALILNG